MRFSSMFPLLKLFPAIPQPPDAGECPVATLLDSPSPSFPLTSPYTTGRRLLNYPARVDERGEYRWEAVGASVSCDFQPGRLPPLPPPRPGSSVGAAAATEAATEGNVLDEVQGNVVEADEMDDVAVGAAFGF